MLTAEGGGRRPKRASRRRDALHEPLPNAAFPGNNGQIVFVKGGADYDESDIYKMNPDGSSQRRLTSSPQIDTDPAWSANGKRIAFVSDRTGRYGAGS